MNEEKIDSAPDVKLTPQELAELGFDTAAIKLNTKLELKRKLALAYEHYRFVTPTIFERFSKALIEKTKKIDIACPMCGGHPEKPKRDYKNANGKCGYCRETGAQRMTHDKLVFMTLAEYSEVPPAEVLGKLREAKARNCFDYFEVAKVQTVEVRPDPIIFGCIKGVGEKFFIAQWDNDVKIEDILTANEG